MDETVQILLIEDDPSHAELGRRAFQSRGDSARLTIVHTLAQAGILFDPDSVFTFLSMIRTN